MGEAGRDLDLVQEPLDPHALRELGEEDLDGDLALVLAVEGEIDGGVPAAAELALDRVAVGEGGGELGEMSDTGCVRDSGPAVAPVPRNGPASRAPRGAAGRER